MRQDRATQGRKAGTAMPRDRRWAVVAGLLASVLAGGCATGPQDRTPAAPNHAEAPGSPVVAADDEAAAAPAAMFPGWRGFALPGKRLTDYRLAERDGRPALHARSERSASMARRSLNASMADLGDFAFSWWVPRLIPDAVLGDRDRDDSPVRVVLAFDGDHSRLPLKERLQFELAEALTGERPPYATLMYVWDPRRATGEVIVSPRTDRIRKLVVETGETRLKRWVDYRRDVLADYRRVYGEEPGALLAVGVMTDSDNTQSRAEAWYGEPAFLRKVGKAGHTIVADAH